MLEAKVIVISCYVNPQVHIGFNTIVFTVHNSSCGKVMFSLVPVCPQGGGGVHPPR